MPADEVIDRPRGRAMVRLGSGRIVYDGLVGVFCPSVPEPSARFECSWPPRYLPLGAWSSAGCEASQNICRHPRRERGRWSKVGPTKY